jgi:uncharacterized protein
MKPADSSSILRASPRAAFRTAGLVAALLFSWGAVSARAASDVVISQVYGGGGNSGATLKNDFVELFNRSGAPVSLTGWSIQYASASGTTWQVTALSGTLQPGQYYLVQEAQGSGGTVTLPTPDAAGTIAMSAGGGSRCYLLERDSGSRLRRCRI